MGVSPALVFGGYLSKLIEESTFLSTIEKIKVESDPKGFAITSVRTKMQREQASIGIRT